MVWTGSAHLAESTDPGSSPMPPGRLGAEQESAKGQNSMFSTADEIRAHRIDRAVRRPESEPRTVAAAASCAPPGGNHQGRPCQLAERPASHLISFAASSACSLPAWATRTWSQSRRDGSSQTGGHWAQPSEPPCCALLLAAAGARAHGWLCAAQGQAIVNESAAVRSPRAEGQRCRARGGRSAALWHPAVHPDRRGEPVAGSDALAGSGSLCKQCAEPPGAGHSRGNGRLLLHELRPHDGQGDLQSTRTKQLTVGTAADTVSRPLFSQQHVLNDLPRQLLAV